NARVTITNIATGVTSSVSSNSTGNYTFSLVPVGNYDVKAEMSGFKSEEVKGLRVETAAQVRQDFQLQVGAVSETVEVSACPGVLKHVNGQCRRRNREQANPRVAAERAQCRQSRRAYPRRPVRQPHGSRRRAGGLISYSRGRFLRQCQRRARDLPGGEPGWD